jgi:drug/metabolite transporter (DMT)-like permease
MKNRIILGHAMAFITVFIWGTTFVSTKILLRTLDPVQILFYRFLIAYMALLVIYPKFNRKIDLKEELWFFLAGLCGVTLYFLSENTALNYTLASNVGLLVAAAPILTALLAHLFTADEKFGKNLVFGFIIAIAGVFLVIFNGSFILKLSPAGDLLALSAALVWSFYCLILKRLGSRHSYIYMTRKIFFYGLIATIPALFIFDFHFEVQKLASLSVIGNILFLGLAASSMCYVFWNTSINYIGVVRTTGYIYLIPLITIITSVIVLSEVITALAVLGAVLILFGVYVSEHGFAGNLMLLKRLTGAKNESKNVNEGGKSL